jgi:hypothetical protein
VLSLSYLLRPSSFSALHEIHGIADKFYLKFTTTTTDASAAAITTAAAATFHSHPIYLYSTYQNAPVFVTVFACAECFGMKS